MTGDVGRDAFGFARCPVCGNRMAESRIAHGECWCCQWRREHDRRETAGETLRRLATSHASWLADRTRQEE